MNIVFVGHVDHGKSTLIGRLLAETGALPQGKLENLRRFCEQNSKPFEYAFLLDALSEEQAQGITIDIARCFFKTLTRHYLILDAPGHLEFLKNFITGAANAEGAFLVIDAQEGVQENTLRHAYLLSMLGVKQTVILINKMDAVAFSEKAFHAIKTEISAYLKKIHIEPSAYIPVSGRDGDNIIALSKRMPWHQGLTLTEALDSFYSSLPENKLTFRMPIQDVYKFTRDGDNRRIMAGQILTGTLRIGDLLRFYPSGKQGTVKAIEAFNSPPVFSVGAGYSTGFTLQEHLYIKRGEVACLANEEKPIVASIFESWVFWLGPTPLRLGKTYELKLGTTKVNACVEKILKVFDTASLNILENACEVSSNQAAECVLKLEYPIAFDITETHKAMTRFVLIDHYNIAGGGTIKRPIFSSITPHQSLISHKERHQYYQQKSIILWFTGLSGSGKTTLATALEKKLIEAGKVTCLLDGDSLRKGLNADLGFTDEARRENIRRIAELSIYLGKQGLIILVSAISPHRDMRQFARSKAEAEGIDFIEIYVNATLETCQARDPKQLYKAAMKGMIPSFTGIDSAYEVPENPDLTLDTENFSIEDCLKLLLTHLQYGCTQENPKTLESRSPQTTS